MKNENVRFIRKNGRVIPIRVKGSFKPKKQKKPKPMAKETKFALQSAGFTLAGIASSLFAGKKQVKTLKRAERTSQQTFRFVQEKTDYLPTGIKSPSEGFIKARKQLRRSRAFGIGGQVIGGALLSQGVQRALRSQGVEIDNPVIDVGAEAGSQVASALISREAKKMMGIRPKFSVKVPNSIKIVGKDIATRFIKRQLRLKI
jgi:hypothetical protein